MLKEIDHSSCCDLQGSHMVTSGGQHVTSCDHVVTSRGPHLTVGDHVGSRGRILAQLSRVCNHFGKLPFTLSPSWKELLLEEKTAVQKFCFSGKTSESEVTHTHSLTHPHAHNTHTHISTHTNTHKHTPHTDIHKHIHAHTQSHTHTPSHTQRHIHTLTHT